MVSMRKMSGGNRDLICAWVTQIGAISTEALI